MKNYYLSRKKLCSCWQVLSLSLISFGQTPSVDLLPQDTKYQVKSATASASQPGEGIDKSYDDDLQPFITAVGWKLLPHYINL